MKEKQVEQLIRDTIDDVGMPSGLAGAWGKALRRNTSIKPTHKKGLNPTKPFNAKVLKEILNTKVMGDEF